MLKSTAKQQFYAVVLLDADNRIFSLNK